MDCGKSGLTAKAGALVFAVIAAVASVSASAQTTLFQEPEIVAAASEGNFNRIKELVARNTSLNKQDSRGRTALAVAAIGGETDIAALLLDSGARTDIVDDLGNSALSWAASQGESDIVRLLLEAGADVDSQNRQGQTPLMLASSKGQFQSVRLLLEAGADVSILDYTGRGALGWARDARNPRVERLLEEAGATD